MLRVYVFDALESTGESVACAREEGAALEEVGETASCCCGGGRILKGIVVVEEFVDEVDAMAREVCGCREEFEEGGGVVV